jgi:plasmid stabilization system protein ParE
MNAVFSRRFQSDFEANIRYLVSVDAAAAARLAFEVDGSIERVIEFPFLGQRTGHRTVRRLVTSEFGYLIYYAVTAQKLESLALTHGRQKRPFKEI